ncbi:DMT family transporter [Flavisolibacter nicotianae]|uniref:DMT family transporter n=1 Tax=Flavisolibacter nicotianae TaxID=2364882 RepID=UPI000EAFAA0C|nr:EamA family transporter [Flavisolibacter nicotianae]
MRKGFSFPKVSDALNGIVAASRQATFLKPFALRQKGARGRAVFALGVVCFLWGTTWVASKEGVRHMPALQLAGLRQSIGGLLYVLFFVSKGASFPKGKEWGPIVVLGLLNFTLSNGLSTWGVKFISAGLGAIIGSIFPLWLVVIHFFGSRSTMNRRTILGLVLGFFGICVIFYEHLQDFFDPQFRFGILLSLISTWSWAFGTLYTKEHALKFNAYFALGLQMIISGPLLYFISAITHNNIPFGAIPWQSWAAIGYLAVFGSVLSFIAYLYALQNLPTEQASIYAYINPVVAFAIGAVFFGEKITAAIVIGILITLYGVYIVNRSVRRNREA